MNILPAPSSPSPSSLPIPLVPRTESDPPTPLTRLLFAVRLANQLRSILHLESRLGSNPHSYSLLDTLHNEFLSIESQTPAWLRIENPDRQFDALPQCYWIPYARASMPPLMAFNIMALHRPYIFTRAVSRTEALRASLGMLQAQRYHFASLKPAQYKMFSLFFGTFDAIVLVAAVYILFPNENLGLVKIAVRHFAWAVERFRAMSGRNGLARAALGVLRAVEVRFLGSLGLPPNSISGIEGKGEDKGKEKVPLLKTRAGLMPLPWADEDGPKPEWLDLGTEGISRSVGVTGTVVTAAYKSHTGSMGNSSGLSSPSSSVSPATGVISSYLPATSANTGLDVNSSAANIGPFPSSSSSNGPGSASLASSHLVGTARETSQSWGYNTMSTPSIDITGGESSVGLDPGASGVGGQTVDSAWDWNLSLPSDFDWSSLQPIFATGDLLYNDLQLHADGTGWATGSSGDGNNLWDGHGGGDLEATTREQTQTGSATEGNIGGDINMANGPGDGTGTRTGERNSGLASQGGGGTNNNAWLFEGDFGNHSIWSLLNQYGPPGPQS